MKKISGYFPVFSFILLLIAFVILGIQTFKYSKEIYAAVGTLTIKGGKWSPEADSTTAMQITNAAGTSFVNFDSTNSRVGVGTTSPAGTVDLVSGNTTQTAMALTAASLTTGESFDITSTSAPTNGSTNESIDLNITHTPTSSADNFRSIDLDTSDGTALANTVYGIDNTLTLTGNAAKTGIGDYSTVTSSSTTADTLVGIDAATSSTGIMTTGTRNVYGARIQPVAGAESTGGTTNVYGVYSKPSADVAAGGTVNSYGMYIANGTTDTHGTSTNIGLYVETPSGADTNYAAIFAGGNVGIGTTAPAYNLQVDGTAAVTSTLRTNGNLEVDGNIVIDDGGGWHRSYGNTGWYNGTWATGWYSTGAGYILGYNSSGISITVPTSGSSHLCYGAFGIVSICSSDARLKENIRYFDKEDQTQGINLVNRLKPVYFDWKPGKGDKNEVGFIAQDLLPILPAGLIKKSNIDGYYTFDQATLMPFAIRSIQDLDKKIVGQQKEIDLLKQTVAELQNEINLLKEK